MPMPATCARHWRAPGIRLRRGTRVRASRPHSDTSPSPWSARKEASLSRHPGWQEYKARSGFLLPWLGRAPPPSLPHAAHP